jgi:hypothetical protein
VTKDQENTCWHRIEESFLKGEVPRLGMQRRITDPDNNTLHLPGWRPHYRREGRCHCLCAQGRREARYEFDRRLQTLNVGRKIDYLSRSGRWGASGIYMASLLERLGIGAEMKPKTKLSPSANVLYASVANGDVEIGFNQISEVLAQPSVEFAGPLPSEIQNYTQFAPGVVTGSNQTEAARALVTFLTSPVAQTVLKAKGFE